MSQLGDVPVEGCSSSQWARTLILLYFNNFVILKSFHFLCEFHYINASVLPLLEKKLKLCLAPEKSEKSHLIWILNHSLWFFILNRLESNKLEIRSNLNASKRVRFQSLNSQAVGLNSWVQSALKSLLKGSLFLKRLHDFSLLSSNLF